MCIYTYMQVQGTCNTANVRSMGAAGVGPTLDDGGGGALEDGGLVDGGLEEGKFRISI